MTGETLFKSDMRLMFAQVREDAAVDEYLLAQTGNRAGRVLVIASGGCTAFSLISAGAHEVEAIDVNQSQLALVDKKIKLLKSEGFEAFKTACLAAHGLNNCGWVDSRMLQLTALFYAFVHSRTETQKFLLMEDTQMQKVYFEKTWSNWRWRLMTNIAFGRLFLRLTHGPAASKA
jgi:S-adenosylmethionine:diacylglycerol 3-amino-3-carboxypropyl transferase